MDAKPNRLAIKLLKAQIRELQSAIKLLEDPAVSSVSKSNRRDNWSDSPLDAAKVLEIRGLWAAKDLTQGQIAARFGVGRSCISEIVRRQRWKHV